jgi:signal transduction histidine kinase
MSPESEKNSTRRPWRRWLVTGEAMFAWVGLSAAGVVLAMTLACAWWALTSQRQSVHAGRHAELKALATVLAARAQDGLRSGDLAEIRSLMATASAEHGLDVCRLVLAGGTVIADPSGPVSTDPLPEAWGHAVAAPEAAESSEPTARVVTPVVVQGKGSAVLEVAGPIRYPWAVAWEVKSGVAAIGACGLCLLWLVYRRLRLRLVALGAIGQALGSIAEGGRGSDLLAVRSDLGVEARHWNDLIAEMDRLRRRGPSEKPGEPGSTRRPRDGELSSACDALWQGLLLADERLHVRYANGAAAAFLGRKREDLVGAELAKVSLPAEVLDLMRGVASGTMRQRRVAEIRRQPGPRAPGEEGGVDAEAGVLRVSVRPLKRDEGTLALVLIEDVTQQRVADESRNSFVAQATHELRTPLTNIRLYVEELLDPQNTDEQGRAQAINVISGEVRRLERIVGDMLSVAEIEAGSLRLNRDDVRLETLFPELEHDYRPQAEEKRINLKFHLPPKLPVIQGDRDKLALALHNVIGNALKYTPDGGEVTVAVNTDNSRVDVAVTDTGYGIRPEERELIFQKFYRAKDDRVRQITGSGLGLALARDVVRMHGGEIAVESQLNKGSTFTVTLPAGRAA